MATYIYVMQSGDTDRCKVGVSKNPESRLRQLQTGNHRELKIVLIIGPFDESHAYRMEKHIHQVLDANHLRILGEWFKAEAPEVSYIVGMVSRGYYIQQKLNGEYSCLFNKEGKANHG